MTNWLSRNVPVIEYDGWAFLKADSNIGTWRPKGGSPNTLEEYCVSVGGTWVPAVDADWLLGFRKTCACGNNRKIWMFAQLTPTKRQMSNRPQRSPVLRQGEQFNFGLEKTEGD